ncbi:sigma-70 family RNA polymerase sigma factor [Pseudolysinimonas sp.]|uniref:sigma-70 family RNA polymerase sigma factor n=1 Tax=Pseudolysinimonas sp. TaxID=2680009 RepID=UPI003F7EF0E9
MSSQISKLTTSDAELIESARSGDTRAYGELWQRHFRSAARVARQCTSSIDADDLVSEAYARIFQRVLAGGGPAGAFRPYLYTTIRNLAATWGVQQSHSVQVDLMEDFEDERIPDDPATYALDRTLTARAFRSLPERWQTVLWYTEVEGMDPHEVAPLMGMTANGVAALSYRAREGLRKAWLQAHINDAQASGECQFVMSKLGDHARDGLGERDRKRVEEHLATCTKCAIVSEEVEEVGSHLSFVLIPLILGGVVGGGVLAAMAAPSSAMAASSAAVPALPAAVQAVGTAATAGSTVAASAAAGGLGFSAATGTLVGSLAVAAVLGGGLAVGTTVSLPPTPTIAPPTAAQLIDPAQAEHILDAVPVVSAAPVTGAPGDGSLLAAPAASGPAVGGVGGTVSQVVGDVGTAVGGVVGGVGQTVGGVVGGVVGGAGQTVGGVVSGVGQTVGGVVDSVTPPGGAPVQATVNLDLSGTGTPGATVTAQVAGSVYTTVVAQDGHWALHVSGLPQGTNSATVSQAVGGLVGGLLGVLGIQPFTLDVAPLGISVSLLGNG